MQLFLAIVLLLAQPATGGARGQDEPAADFAVKDLHHTSRRLSDYKGKVVLINFWATWCAPCRAEMPELNKWQKKYQRRGLRLIGVTFPPYNARKVRRVVRKLKITYPIVLGSKELAGSYAAGDILPLTVIVDREGRIHGRILGIIEPEEFEQQIRPLLK